jgi:hypothetical protein
MNEIEISNKAFNVAYQLQTVAAQIASLSAEAGRVQMACNEYANGDITPNGYNIDPIPNTPFVVIYRPNEDGEIHGIYCRGVEVTDYVTWTVGEDAQQIVIQAFDGEKTANEEWSAEQRFEAQRLGE